MALKKLGVVKNILDSVGMDMSHAYDDLIFLDHNAFLLQFTDEEDAVIIHCNAEADRASLQKVITILKGAALTHKMTFIDGGDYSLSQVDDENVQVEFSAEKV